MALIQWRLCGFRLYFAKIVSFKNMNSRSAGIFCALFLCVVVAVWFIAPSVVSADHSFTHTVQELRMHFNALVESFLGARWNGAPDAFSAAALLAVVDDTRVQKLETELQSYQSRIEQLKLKPQTDREKRELKSLEDEVSFVQSKLDELRGGGLRLTRTLRLGSSGNDVKHLQEFLAKDKEVYPGGLATGYFGKLTEDAVKRFQEKNGIDPAGVVGPKTRAVLAEDAPGVASVEQSVAPKGLLSRILERGVSGDDVRGAQGLLNRFPDIYPQGSATGFYGSATENAVKKLQEKLGLPATGGIDDATKKKINELALAVERKHPPKISSIGPSEIFVGIKATITGSGFALENNSLFVKGKTILAGLTSHDGTEIVFSVPSDIPCDIGSACPIKIINANGISNAKPFKLVAAVPVLEPTPEPTPTPTPTPVPTPTPEPTPAPCVPVTLNVPGQYPIIQGAIDATNCPGTIIQIAAGTYYEILVMKSDLTLIGAGPGQTIIDGSKTPATINPWGYLVQNFNVITAGKLGAGLKNIQIKNLSITGSGGYGDNAAIRIQDSSNVLIENVLFYRNTDGLRIYSSSPVTVKNVTLVGNYRNGVMSHGTTNVTVKNSIIAQNSMWGLYATTGAQLTSAYNAVWGNGTNYDGVVSGVGDISLDPRLESAPQYLVSSGSPTRDAGDPADAYAYEPSPNCGRINMGSYGNTQWATICSVPVLTPPILTSISPSIVTTGMRVTLNGTGFTPTNNTVTFTGSFTEPNQVLSGIASSDGVTLDVTIPAIMPCRPLVVSQCSVFVTNQNGQSDRISFWLGQHVDPVRVLTPNGGEQLTQGASSIISASGGVSEAFSNSISVSYALVDVSATGASDPSALIIGWIQHDGSSISWGANKLCDYDNANAALPAPGSCWSVSPGNYKILAVGRDTMNQPTIWDSTANAPGNIDVSDQAFSIIPAPIPTLSVVSPNGGEAYKYGDAVTITWEAKNIASKLVNIRLLKAGSPTLTIASNVTQSSESGMFVRNWIVPSTVAVGTDYMIEISDAANASVKDASDGQFRIANLAALQIYGPNGGETAMRGFSALLFWTYSGYYPVSINVNLYKGGSFYRTLATGVKPAGFSGYTILREPYPLNARYVEMPIALDIPEGDDYTLEIVDGADSLIRDKSDASFRIISIPALTTFKGRYVDVFSGAPLATVSFGGYSTVSNLNGTSYGIALPRFTTDTNGAFSFATTTNDLVSVVRTKPLYSSWPSCYDTIGAALVRWPDMPRVSQGSWFGNLYPVTSIRRQLVPLTSSVMDFGDIVNWPSTSFVLYSDIPVSWGISYGSSGIGGSFPKTAQMSSNVLALEYDIRAQLTDQAGNKYYSPYIRLSKEHGCVPQALSFIGGQFTWEPYVLTSGLSYSDSNLIVGTTYNRIVPSPTTGSAPYAWSVLYGVLPQGLALDGTRGVISGTPVAAGVYPFTLRVVDAKGVNAAVEWTMTVR